MSYHPMRLKWHFKVPVQYMAFVGRIGVVSHAYYTIRCVETQGNVTNMFIVTTNAYVY